ncbi:MAG TPA: dihydropteroate synthase [Thermoanaerobaculia bacterium]|nr:dihydropteroate synthase [Thermoanaerobaculia bacterium]
MRAGMDLPNGRILEFRSRPMVMGIINVTPDSFSDGGVHLSPAIAIESALHMEREGAAIIDVGGESTRPGAQPVPLQQELDRVIPIIEGIRRVSNVLISIDTMKSPVALEAGRAGADILNDVTALEFDEGMAGVARSLRLGVILMHIRGEPRTMQDSIHYDDVMSEIKTDLQSRIDHAVDCGIDPELLLIDPGIGFGKTSEHNVEILARLSELRELRPLVVGASRKGFIGKLTGKPGGPARSAGSLAAAAAAANAGAAIVRVHDVAETVDFLEVFAAISAAALKAYPAGPGVDGLR